MENKIVKAAIKIDKKIYTGFNHSECFNQLDDTGKNKIKSAEFGFVDSNGDFHDRIIAKEIAKKAGQIPLDYPGVLISEDIFFNNKNWGEFKWDVKDVVNH